MPQPTVQNVTDRLTKAADAQLAVTEAARKAAEAAKAPPPPPPPAPK